MPPGIVAARLWETLAARNGIGLFYFASHRAQLGWRNYLVRVARSASDAAIPWRTIQSLCSLIFTALPGLNATTAIDPDASVP